MVGRVQGIVVSFGVLALAIAPTAAGASPRRADDRLPRLHGLGSARTVELTTTTRNGKPIVLRTTGSVDFRRRVAQRTTRPRGVQAAETRNLGDDLYYRGAPRTSTPPGRPWTHVRSRFVPNLAVEDPADVIRGFRPNRPAVQRVGAARVHGVATTHYRLTSTVPVAPKLLAAGLVGNRGHTDVWIDARGRVRRLRFPVPASGGIPASTRTTDYLDPGTTVHVERPAADTVTEDSTDVAPGRATGRPVTIGSGNADGETWRARRIPTGHGWCTNLRVGGRDQPYGYRIGGSGLLGAPCGVTPTPDGLDFALDVLPNGAQVIWGVVPDGATGGTVHFDDDSTQDVAAVGGGVAFAIVGNRIAPWFVVNGPGDGSTCTLDAGTRSYGCTARTFSSGPPPTVDTSPR